MRLRSIEVDNFLGHEKESLLFPSEGIFVLTGVSGSGKSSLLIDAPGYALFGSVATRVRKRKQVALRHRDHPGQSVSVKVLYEFDDGERLLFSRGIDERDSTWAEVYSVAEDGSSELVASGAQEVSRIVARKVGVDWRQFYASFVCRQDELTLLTRLRGQERKELVQQMLGMRELEQSAEILTKRLRRINQELRSLEQAIGDYDPDKALERKDELALRKETLLTRLKEEEEALATDQARAKKLEEELKAEQEARQALQERANLEARVPPLKEEIAALDAKLIEQGDIAKRLEARQSLTELVDSLANERDSLREQYQAARALATNQERAQELSKEISELREGYPVLSGPAQSLIEERANLRASVSSRQRELEERKVQFKELEGGGECFVCLRPLEGEAVFDHLTKHITDVEKAAAEETAKLAPLEEVGDNLDRYATLQAALQEVEQSINDIGQAGDVEDLRDRGLACSEKLEKAKQELTELDVLAKQLDENLAGKIDEKKKELRSLTDRLGLLPEASEEDSGKDAELRKLMQEIGSREGRIPELKREVKQSDEDLAFTEKEIAAVSDKQERLSDKRQQALDLEQLQTFLQGFQRKLAHDIRPALEEIGSEMLSQISGGKHVGMKIDDNYEIEVERQEGTLLPASMLSGGEQIRANLCLRLALTRLVSQRTGVPFRILALDEPLPAQDPGHAERIMELLASLRPYYGQQFIISHVGDLASADQTDYLIEFAGGSGPDQVDLVYA